MHSCVHAYAVVFGLSIQDETLHYEIIFNEVIAMVFHEASKECYVWLKKQPNVKEESLTDWLLYTVSKKTDKFYYKAFTRNEEAKYGADWEWWILTNSNQNLCAYRFLVQAKKLKKDKDNYPLLCYGNRNGLQIDLLIDAAKLRNAMPIYIYYSVSVPDLMEQQNNFRCFAKHFIALCEKCRNGAYLSMAQTVKEKIFNSPRKKIFEAELLNNSLGFSMCDLLFNHPAMHPFYRCSAERIMELLNRCYIKSMCDNESENTNGIRHSGNSIPGYLKTFIDRNGEQLDWYESEFKHYINDISGIAIIDLREK